MDHSAQAKGEDSTSTSAAPNGSGSGEPKSRSRTACQNCRSTKQRCDGPSRIPCRRCELYNLECIFTDAPQRTAVKRKAPDDGSSQYSVPTSYSAAPLGPDTVQTILNKLEQLTSQTAHIEDYLRYSDYAHRSSGSAKRGRALPSLDELDLGLPDATAAASHRRMGNPMSTIVESFQGLEEGPSIPGAPGSAGLQNLQQPNSLSPDAISRGLMTMEQARRYFAFFVDHCRFWVHGIVPSHLDDPDRIRVSCPLLFGAILCVSTYYLEAPNDEAGLQLYLNLVSLVNETLAPIIMSPQPSELDDEFVLGLAICIIWKMPRIRPKGMVFTDFAHMQNQAKLNNSTTYFLAGIVGRAARVNQLYATPRLFLGGDRSPATLRRLRLWLWMCFVDCHGCMQNGRGASFDIAETLQVTRSFAAIGDAATDVELSALLEVSAVYGTFHGASEDDKTDIPALARANGDLDSITKYWYQQYPRLAVEGAFVTQFIAPFHRLVINADVYRTWSVRNKAAQEAGATAALTLNTEEGHFLEIAVESAVTMIMYLTTAARTDNGRRVPKFEQPEYWKDGLPVYKPFEPDVDHARHIRTAVDTAICVILCFSAMFLAKLRAADLMRCNLIVVSPQTPVKPQERYGPSGRQIMLYSKFFRVIELASDFLEMAAPNAGHPCLTHSRVLRQLLATATGQMLATATVKVQQRQPELDRALNQSPNGRNQAVYPTSSQAVQSNQSLPPFPPVGSMPRFSHSLMGHATLNHSADSPLASMNYVHPTLQPGMATTSVPQSQVQSQHLVLPQHLQMPPNGMPQLQDQPSSSFSEMLTGIGQPGNPLVTSFLGGDEWSMLMDSLGLQPQ